MCIRDRDYTEKLVQGWLAQGDGGAYTGSNYSRILWAFFIFEQWFEQYAGGGQNE